MKSSILSEVENFCSTGNSTQSCIFVEIDDVCSSGRTKLKIQFAEFLRLSNHLNHCPHLQMLSFRFGIEVRIINRTVVSKKGNESCKDIGYYAHEHSLFSGSYRKPAHYKSGQETRIVA